MTSDDVFSAVSAPLARALVRRGFASLTPIQQAVTAPELVGRDLRISSRTGSGKTVALGLVLGRLLSEPPEQPRGAGRARPRALLVAPTRELAAQIGRELTWLFAELKMSICVVTGGTSVGGERRALSMNPTVLVGTPGRLCDHLSHAAIDLSGVEAIVLDEADQMLELGFREPLEMLLSELPTDRQTHLVSATFPRVVEALAARYQKKGALLVQGGAANEAHADIAYVAHLVHPAERYGALINVLLMAPSERTLVFVRTRVDATMVATRLANDGFRAAALSGELAQAERTRTLEAFRAGTLTVLVCTDVASRGIDIPDVHRVIHGDLPDAPEPLTHRSGRTGRAGNKGTSVLLVPAHRKSFAEMLLRGARVRARFCPAPTANDVREAAEERVVEELTSAAEGLDPATHAELAARLLDILDPDVLTQLLLARLNVHGPVAPRDLSVVEERPRRVPAPFKSPQLRGRHPAGAERLSVRRAR
jgi:ATP-dependent RNA helicase DeaD